MPNVGGGKKEGNGGLDSPLSNNAEQRERERVNISIASVEYIERGAHHSVATYLISDISLIYVILCKRLLGEEEEVRIGRRGLKLFW